MEYHYTPRFTSVSHVAKNRTECRYRQGHYSIITPGRRQWKTLIPATNVDQKSLKTEFLTGICRPTGDKWQSKTLFLSIFDPRSSIVKRVFSNRLPGVIIEVAYQKHTNMISEEGPFETEYL